MKEIIVYQVDLWDGGDRHNFGFYLSSKTEADKYKAVDKHCYVHQAKVITIFDTLEEKDAHSIKSLKEQALKKLSPAERQALGFPPE
jgi:hypothetical protein